MNRRMYIPVPRLVRRRRRAGMGEDDDSGSLIFGDSGGDAGGGAALSFPWFTGSGTDTYSPPAGWSTGASSGSMLDPNIGVTQDANGNWLNAAGQLTNFGGGGSASSGSGSGSSGGSSSSSGGNSSNWLSGFLNNAFGLANKTLTPPSYQQTCTAAGVCTTTVRNNTAAPIGSSLSLGATGSIMPWLIGGGLLVVFAMASKK